MAKNHSPATVSRAEVQRAIWFLLDYRGPASRVDRLLTVIDEYAMGHGAILTDSPLSVGRKRVEYIDPQDGSYFDNVLPVNKRLRCNSCGHFKELKLMCTDWRAADGVRPTCIVCREQPPKAEFKGQRVYRVRTGEGWTEARRARAKVTSTKGSQLQPQETAHP